MCDIFPAFFFVRKRFMADNTQKFTVFDFFRLYPDDDTCLEAIFQLRYGHLTTCPNCGRARKRFHRIKARKCYECRACHHQLYPLAGTPLAGSTTKLTVWFFAIYLFATSRNGVSAKELQRQLGVTYKTAWRMGQQIRELMVAQEATDLQGVVEVDEALLGGVARGGKRGWGAANKTCLLGMIERGGQVLVIPVEKRNGATILPLVQEHVQPGTVVNTDEFQIYDKLPSMGYGHQTVVHSKYQWAQGEAHTNSIEGYWSNLKKSIRGTHTFVSPKHLPRYLAEFSFRHNHRQQPAQMFEKLLEGCSRCH
ncbi:IS1595 family transposase [Hymenobacter sp. ASUV-10]|uniref:IS1595 family transposase n=1 Tax=Hymenobacter aranciens TaxID=3063996 RepID=A0ABT9B7R0_9BACT|nr:IS1595 family transposase [Hymenobacter sp. ASUV-10]MDO7874233.1 IS1595 family transposase [Hymenobacter sp. ASUV-10]